MAKDFAKRTKKLKSASRFDKQKTKIIIPGWVWLIAGLILGLSASILIYLQIPAPEAKPVSTKESPKPSAKSKYQAVPETEASDSGFSFHGELETKTVEVPVDKSAPVNKKTTDKRFIMQCGSFKKKERAESLRAQIALNGFEANIKATVEKNNIRWFRVSLGPYNSKRLAERDRHQLERNNINHCMIWQKKPGMG